MDPNRPSDRANAPTVSVSPSFVQGGTTVGPYRLLQRLGEGGMGEVWLAEQTEPIHRQVAFKVIKLGMDSAQVVARFEAERQALALMDHPAIATVFDGGTTPAGRLYFAMEYVKGEPITTYCDRHKLPMAERLALFVQVCQGVQHAHQKGIIHRDLKPSNVLVTIVDGHPVPKIIDFGVAKATAQHLTERTLFTELGVMIGTPEYMSPEQAEMGGLDIDTRTDVYALGVLLYELLTGALPFDRQTLREKALDEIRRTIREVDPPKPSTRVKQLGLASTASAKAWHRESTRLASQLRGDLDWITMKALEKDRTRRYDSATGLANDVVRHLANEPVAAGPPSAWYRSTRFLRRHRFGVGAGGVVALLVVLFGVMMAFQARRVVSERDRANREASASKQVSDFLVGLFRVSDPSEARGSSITAREILDRGAKEIDRTLGGQPEVQARLQATIGDVYTSLGVYRSAVPLLEAALATRRRVLGDDDPDTLSTINQLANAYWFLDQMGRAEPLYSEVIERRRRVLGAMHPETLRAQSDLASLYSMQRRWDVAEQLTRSTLEAQLQVLGEDHGDALTSMNNLGSVYFRQGRYADAEPVAVRVWEIDKRVRGIDHPATLVAMHNVATVYDKLGKDQQAEAVYLENIALKRRVLGDQHRQTARTQSMLSSMYARQRRFAEAEPLAVAAYQAFLATLGPSHENTRAAGNDLSKLYDAWGKPLRAAQWRAKLVTPPGANR